MIYQLQHFLLQDDGLDYVHHEYSSLSKIKNIVIINSERVPKNKNEY